MEITCSKQTAKALDQAIHFFYVSCTKATAENPDGINDLSPERMKLLKMTPKKIDWLISVAIQIQKKTKMQSKAKKPAN